VAGGEAERQGAVLFFSVGSCFYDRPNSLLLVVEPPLFINLNICGQFWGKVGKFGRNQPEKRTLIGSDEEEAAVVRLYAQKLL
jgi:hypothetical protein